MVAGLDAVSFSSSDSDSDFDSESESEFDSDEEDSDGLFGGCDCEGFFSACSSFLLLTFLTSPGLYFSSSSSSSLSLSDSDSESEPESDESVEELASALLLVCVFVFTGNWDFCPLVVPLCLGVCVSSSLLLLEGSLAALSPYLRSDSDPDSDSDSEEDELSPLSELFWLDSLVF